MPQEEPNGFDELSGDSRRHEPGDHGGGTDIQRYEGGI